MKKQRNKVLLITLIFSCLIFSCRSEDFSINEIHCQGYVKTDTRMGLAFYFQTDCKDPLSITMVITDPTKTLSWETKVMLLEYNGTSYYGTSSICMPLGVELPLGLWHANIYYKDGSAVKKIFNISYSDVQGALERYSNQTSVEYFDRVSNLIVF